MRGGLLVLSSFVLLATASVFAQQDKLITHFMYDKMSINPGATGMGMKDAFCGTTIYRNQWDKVNGAPNSAVLNLEGSLGRVSDLLRGFGLSFYHDAIAFTRQNNLVLNYSYHKDFSGVGTLGIGAGVGFTNLGMTPEWVPPTNNFDPTLPTAFSDIKFDMNFGIYFRADAGWYAGISSTHLSASTLTPDIVAPAVVAPFGFAQARHYYAMGGWKRQNTWGGTLDLNGLFRSDFVKSSAEISARYIRALSGPHKFYGGLGFRFVESIPVMLGYMYQQDQHSIHAGYAYDISTNKFSSISRGTHELMFKYCYALLPVPISKSKHPRWL